MKKVRVERVLHFLWFAGIILLLITAVSNDFSLSYWIIWSIGMILAVFLPIFSLIYEFWIRRARNGEA